MYFFAFASFPRQITVDALGLPGLDLLKIDVEGLELKVPGRPPR